MAKFRQRVAEEEAAPIRQRLEEQLSGYTVERWPELPGGMSDRAEDLWEPLVSIADAAGADWPERARQAALSLTGTDPSEESAGIRLLADIASLEIKVDRIPTSELLAGLWAIEEAPWGDWYGKPLSARRLAEFLKPFRVAPTTVRVGEGTAKGYKLEDFVRAWQHWLPEVTPQSVTSEATLGLEPDPEDKPDPF